MIGVLWLYCTSAGWPWDGLQHAAAQAASVPDHLHLPAAGRAGEGLLPHPLPRRLHQVQYFATWNSVKPQKKVSPLVIRLLRPLAPPPLSGRTPSGWTLTQLTWVSLRWFLYEGLHPNLCLKRNDLSKAFFVNIGWAQFSQQKHWHAGFIVSVRNP